MYPGWLLGVKNSSLFNTLHYKHNSQKSSIVIGWQKKQKQENILIILVISTQKHAFYPLYNTLFVNYETYLQNIQVSCQLVYTISMLHLLNFFETDAWCHVDIEMIAYIFADYANEKQSKYQKKYVQRFESSRNVLNKDR